MASPGWNFKSAREAGTAYRHTWAQETPMELDLRPSGSPAPDPFEGKLDPA